MIASIILAIYLFEGMPLESAVTLLYIAGILLILSETVLGTFGIAAINGFLALFIAYSLKTGDHTLLGMPVDWGLFFGISMFEAALVATMIMILLRLRKVPVTTGTESMVGEEASIVDWEGKKGRVLVQGETWQAVSKDEHKLKEGDNVTIKAINKLTAEIEPNS